MKKLSKEIQEKIVNMFCNTKYSLTVIWDTVDPEHELMTFEELYQFIVDYRTEDGKALQRNQKRLYSDTENKVFELRKQGYTYQKIVDELREQGYKTSIASVSLICKKLFKENGIEEPILNKPEKIPCMIDDEIYKLRQQGDSYSLIAEYFCQKGIKVSTSAIRGKCKEIYEKRKEKEPKTKHFYSRLENDIYDERIFELREQELPYYKIRDILNREGIRITESNVRKRCKKVYKEKGVKEKARCMSNEKDYEFYNKIYELKKQNYTYKQIAEYFNSMGVRCSYEKIRLLSKKIFEEKGEKEPRGQLYQKQKEKRLEELNNKLPDIYTMRKNGMTFGQITEYCRKEGYTVSVGYIRQRCNELFKEKGEKTAKFKSFYQKEISDEEIYSLKKMGMSFDAIAEYYNEKGFSISYQTIRKRCKVIFAERKEEIPLTKRRPRRKKEDMMLKNYACIKRIGDKTVLINEMLKLAKRKKATEEQLKMFAEEVSKIYGEDIKLDVKLNNREEERSL